MMGTNKNIRVLLVSFNSFFDIAIRIFHGLLESNGYEVKTCIFCYSHEKEINDCSEQSVFLKKIIDEFRPQVVGFRALSSYFNAAQQLTQLIKKINPQIFVVWGGFHTILDPQGCLQAADAICVGEGEDAFLELLHKIKNKDSLFGIKNIWVKDNGKMIKTALRPLRKDLDSLPLPDFTNNNKYFFIPNASKKSRPLQYLFHMFKLSSPLHSAYLYNMIYPILASRGCPHTCSFCTNSTLRDFFENNKGEGGSLINYSHIRQRSVENVIKELIFAKKAYRPVKIIFFDDCFGTSKQWLKEFSGEYRRFVGIPFYCHLVENSISEETARYLKRANCMNVGIGIQSVSERVRKEIFSRNITDEKILEVNSILRKNGIETEYHLIINNPYESFAEYKTGFNRLLCKLKKPFVIKTSDLVFYKKSNISEKAVGDNLIKPSDLCTTLGHFINFTKDSYLNYQFLVGVHSVLGKIFIPNFIIKKILIYMDNAPFKGRFICIVAKLRYFLLLDYVLRRLMVYFKYLIYEIIKPTKELNCNRISPH